MQQLSAYFLMKAVDYLAARVCLNVYEHMRGARFVLTHINSRRPHHVCSCVRLRRRIS